MIQPSVCGEWEKKWNVWACQLSKQKIISVCKNEKKKKCIDTTKIRVDIELERKKKVVEKNRCETNHGFSRK